MPPSFALQVPDGTTLTAKGRGDGIATRAPSRISARAAAAGALSSAPAALVVQECTEPASCPDASAGIASRAGTAHS
jgi:hypothetical protein